MIGMKPTSKAFLTIALTLAAAPPLAAQAPKRRTPQPAAPGAAQQKTPAPAAGRTGSGTTRVTPRPAAPQAAAASPAPATTPDACGCDPKPLPEVLAVVNGVKVTRDEVEVKTRAAVDQVKQQVAEMRRARLDEIIADRLIEAEAKKRGLSPAKLVEAEVIAKAPAPTDAEARAFYDQNSARIGAPFDSVKADLVAYLQQQRRQEAYDKFLQALRAAGQVKVVGAADAAPADAAARARVLASVHGQPVTAGEVEDGLRPALEQAQQQIYTLRKQEVDLLINDVLAEQEAGRCGTIAQVLLSSEVDA